VRSLHRLARRSGIDAPFGFAIGSAVGLQMGLRALTYQILLIRVPNNCKEKEDSYSKIDYLSVCEISQAESNDISRDTETVA